MAYPFPCLPNTPQTPQRLQGIQSPSDYMPQLKSPLPAHRKTVCITIAAFMFFLWVFSPLLAPSVQTDRIPLSNAVVDDFFAHYEGHQDCGIASRQIYDLPALPKNNAQKHSFFCRNRAQLLEAMSGGGRHGFDAPYVPAGCHYRWYSTVEICMILERFDAVVFIGDDTLKHIYTAFNMLLRENIAMGGLKQWELTEKERSDCRCDNQITKPECSSHAITANSEVAEHDAKSAHKSPFHCDRTPHIFLPITTSPAPPTLHDTLTAILTSDPNAYKPIPIIHSLSLSLSTSTATATASMDEWVSLADSSRRNIPWLWVGPNAAGHHHDRPLEPRGGQMGKRDGAGGGSDGGGDDDALWQYSLDTSDEARRRDLEALGMWNVTVQANCVDGGGGGGCYGLRVGLVQAMMVINWLSRVEST